MTTAQPGLLIPGRYHATLAGAGAALSIIPLCAGLYGLYRPRAALVALEFPAPTTPADARLVDGLLRMYAVRQLGIGVGGIVVWATAGPRTMGWMYLASGIAVAATDGLVAHEVAGHEVWGHWVGVGMALGLGSVLVGWV